MKKIVTIYIMLLAILPGAFFSLAQSSPSRVLGVVKDALTGQPLEGAYVILQADQESKTSITTAEGKFEFGEVAPGRYLYQTSLLGYEPLQQEILVISGKDTRLSIGLKESAQQLETVEVQGRRYSDISPDAITLPIEKVMRMPANFFDPVRMLASYAGVVTANDQANNVIVKGNSPSGLLWRLNGMDIVNPNHLSNAGTFSDRPTANGGGVNILSAQMLDRTEFYSGNIPARFGNVSSGVLDMNLRNGNTDKNEFTAQASLIGLDMAAEGPLSSSHNGSFLANYRYSTVGLLSQMGINFGDEAISFQDFSFHLNNKAGKKGTLSLFGLGGLSNNKFKAKPEAEWETEKDRFTISYKSRMYGVGSRYDLTVGEDMQFSAGVTISANEQERSSLSIATSSFPEQASEYQSDRRLISTFLQLNKKWSNHFNAEGGVMLNSYQDQLLFTEMLPGDASMNTVANANVSSFLLQPYLQLGFRKGKISTDVGGRYLYSSLSGISSGDFRGNLVYRLSHQSSLVLSLGQVSQAPTPAVFLSPGNKDLDFMKRVFVELGHRMTLDKWKINTTLYYQEYRDVPVLPFTSFSVLNFMDGIAPAGLTNSGSGTNTGITIQTERSFFSGFYLIGGGSLYDSRYTGGDGIERKTKFDGRYTGQLTLGREKSRQKESKTSAFGIHTRLLYLGGLRDTPIDESASRITGRTIFDESDAYASALNDYFRLDLRLSWRKDKRGYTRTVSLDIQNLTGTKNEAFRYYDSYQDGIKTQYQVGIIPVLVYRIDF